MQLLQGVTFRGCRYSLMFRLPRSLGPQIAPTGASSRLRGSRAVYTTQLPGWLPAPGRGITSRPRRATGAAGLSPAELQPCRLLPNPVTPTIDFNRVFSPPPAHGSRSKRLTVPKTVPVSSAEKRVKFRLCLDAGGQTIFAIAVRSFCPSGDKSFREPPFAAILDKRAAALIERLVLAFRYECPSSGPDHVDRLLNGAGNLRAHISSSGG
jgi:hypothetical protein